MKKLIAFSIAILFTTALIAQKEKQKNNKSQNTKQEARNVIPGQGNSKSKNDIDIIWEGTKDKNGGGPKLSKNQPAKVRAAFAKDYPNAANVSWSKYRGDWTATFHSGILRSVAVYHANGQRKDTRTVIQAGQLPKVILDQIFKKRPTVKLGDIVKIQVPEIVKDIFRIKTIEAGVPRFGFYDADGKEIAYDY